MEPLEFRYDTQLLIEGQNLDEDAVNDCTKPLARWLALGT